MSKPIISALTASAATLAATATATATAFGMTFFNNEQPTQTKKASSGPQQKDWSNPAGPYYNSIMRHR